MESVALKRIYDNCSLQDVLKVGESKVDFSVVPGDSRYQPQLSEARKRPKNMGNFSLSAISRKSLNIDCGSRLGVGRNKTFKGLRRQALLV